MSRPAKLRRLVAKLAGLPTEDVSAILDALTEERSNIVRALLRTYTHPRVGAASDAHVPLVFDTSRLSTWLVDRLSVDRSPDLAITAHSRDVLRGCSAELFQSEPTQSGYTTARAPSLVHRIGTYFSAKTVQ